MVNDKEGILNFVFAPGNGEYRQPPKIPGFIEAFTGKLYTDKGSISTDLAKS